MASDVTSDIIDIATITASFYCFQKLSNGNWGRNSNFLSIDIEQKKEGEKEGVVRVGKKLVKNVEYNTNVLTWNNSSFSGVVQGEIRISRDVNGFLIKGELFLGKDITKASRYEIIGFSVKPVTYTIQISSDTFPSDTTELPNLKDIVWKDCGEMQIDYGVEGTLPKPKISIGLNGDEITDDFVVVSCTQKESQIEVKKEVNFRQFPGEKFKLKLTFDHYLDVYKAPTLAEVIGQTTLRYVQLNAKPDQENVGVPYPEVEDDESSQGHDSSLSVAALRAINISPEKIAESTNALLSRNMKWAMGQDPVQKDWLNRIYGEEPPSLDIRSQKLAKNDEVWYRNTFSKVLLTDSINQFSLEKGVNIHLSQEQSQKLKYFIKHMLPRSVNYVRQAEGLAREAVLNSYPSLLSYVAGEEGEKWAKRLFNSLCDRHSLIQMIERVHSSSEPSLAMEPVQKLATLLGTLQPSGDCAKQYYTLVLHGVIGKLLEDFSLHDKELLSEWLPEGIKAFLQKIGDGTLKFDEAELSEKAVRDLQDYYSHNAVEFNELFIKSLDVSGAGETLYTTINGEKFRLNAKAIINRYPKLTLVVRSCHILLVAYSIYSMYKLLSHSDDRVAIPLREKIQLVGECVMLASQFVEASHNLYIAGREVFRPTKVLFSYEGLKAMEGLSEQMAVAKVHTEPSIASESVFIRRAGQRMLKTIRDAKNSAVLEEETSFKRIFRSGRVIGTVRLIGGVAAVVLAACSVWQLCESLSDEKRETTQKWLDGVETGISVVTSCLMVAELFVVSPYLLPVAMVLIVGGLIFNWTRQGLYPPESQLDKYMREVGVPFVKGIDLDAKVEALVANKDMDGALKLLQDNQERRDVILSVRLESPVGGTGSTFVDWPSWSARLSRLNVNSGDIGDSIQAIYRNQDWQPPQHGGAGGKMASIDLKEDEYITKIVGMIGDYFGAKHITQLTITTNKRENVQTYGTNTHTTNLEPFSFEARPGEMINSFFGRTFTHTDSTEFLSALGVCFKMCE
ncbi:jacalin-like lectin [Microcoleus sp. ARI1-B5]|uniref:jacalin-like lectin n=1 Tax=unclassified Microcoleus TaxID=2642155 RepID=UPI002FD3E8C9